MTPSQKVLMCDPGYFDVSYVINPWMRGQTGNVNRTLARRQWEHLRSVLSQVLKLVFVPGQPGLPDLVFTANAGLVSGDRVIVSRFASSERQAEEHVTRHWFEAEGYQVADWPREVHFEGAGDALFDRGERLLWVGHGFRTHAAAAAIVERIIGCPTIALHLVDPRFYHLDTCLCPLSGGVLLYYPPAFDTPSQERIRERIPAERRIEAGQDDALRFACNAVNVGAYVVMNDASDDLQARLMRAGFTPILTPLSEFMKSGGAAKCLTLNLSER